MKTQTPGRITIRFKAADLAFVQREAAGAGISPSEFLRQAVRGERRSEAQSERLSALEKRLIAALTDSRQQLDLSLGQRLETLTSRLETALNTALDPIRAALRALLGAAARPTTPAPQPAPQAAPAAPLSSNTARPAQAPAPAPRPAQPQPQGTARAASTPPTGPGVRR